MSPRKGNDVNHDAQTPPQDEGEQESELAGAVREAAEAADVLVRFPPRRRQTDLLLVQLRGERRDVLTVPTALAAALDTYDLEIIRGQHVGDLYQLQMAVTEKLDVQARHALTPERRAKLRRRVDLDVPEGGE